MIRTPRALLPFALCCFSLALAACGDDGTSTTEDAGVKPKDATVTPPLDSGQPPCACDLTPGVCDQTCACDPLCGGTPDSGIPPTDSGVPPTDSGVTPPPDSGVGLPDLGPYDGGIPASDPFDPMARASELATASCNRTQTCSPAFFSAGIYTDVNDCIAQNTLQIAAVWNAYNSGITANRVGFNQAAFTTCINALGSADCIQGLDTGTCDTQTIFRGSQAVNRPCSVLAECTTGTFCALQAFGGCGTCQPYALPGQDCSQALCSGGADCFDTTGDGFGDTCAAVNVAQGQACGTIQTGLCRGQLNCQGTDPNYSCQPPAANGAACDSTPQSSVGPFCNILTNDNCNPNTGVCETVTWNAPNTACDGITQLCDVVDTIGCDTQGTMMCVAPPATGTMCNMGACADGNYCDQAGTCQLLKTSGQACMASGECDGAWVCVNNTCADFPYTSCL